jgi:Tol biopolymer transport system component
VNVPSSGQPQNEASWSADGTRLVYVQGPANAGQLALIAPGQQNAKPFPLTLPTANDRNPSFAPTTATKLLAYVDDSGGRSRLCFGIVGPNPLNADCTSHPGWTLGRQVAWSPDGSKILVFGSKKATNGSVFGLIEFVSNVPFSTQASLWGQGTVVTDTSKPGQGVIAGAFSPDGKQLALVSNIGTLDFHLFLTKPDDFKLAHATALPDRACQVSWRPDGKELTVMQADSGCAASLGDIVAVNPQQPNTFTAIATQAANPAWQPLALGG